jgi:Concanavalin A-like lectin/glucanases superfamily/Fibronectin type III domain/Pectate lyase superfamily protein/Abnormal spindle-like microcephaly-assoc'd, ASPM-SPD-2-Hydin
MFGSITSDTSSSAQAVKLSNTGNTSLDISITLSGTDPYSFNESNNCPTSLAARHDCTITVLFTPSMAGNFTAAITVTNNTSQSAQTITLSGAASPISVSVSPATIALNSGQTAQLTATVTNTATKAVTWSITPVGVGSISTSGLFTAPTTINTAQTLTVTATSLADSTASASTTITLEPSATPAISVSIAPTIASTSSGTNLTFTVTVTNALDPSVIWSALLGTITPEGLYTAPSNTGSSTLSDTITATSVQDPTKSATANVTVLSGLVGWWPLDEGMGLVAHDISSQGNNGTWSGIPSSPNGTYYTTGLIGSYAGYFDGSDNQLTIGTRPVYEFTGPFTVSAWVNTVASGTILTMQNSGNNGYNLAINYGVIRFCVYANTTEKCVGGGRYPLSSPAWTYFTAVFDGSNISVYANGVFLASSLAANPTASTGPLVFGAAQRGGYSKFTGSLNDIRMYNRALSTNEISSLYNADVGTPNAPTNLQAYPGDSQMGLSWDSPTSGSTLTDYVVNYRQHNTSLWCTFSHRASTTTSITVTGLTNGVSYDFEVTGVNIAGAGLPSDILTATPVVTSPAISVSIAPTIASTSSGTNLTFTVTVTNALDPSVIWSALLGTITPEGLYTAPSNTGSSTLSDTITATSVQDPTKSATANVTVLSGLVGWWPLDEGMGLVAHDISSQGNNGTWSGIPSSPNGTYYTTGLIGSYAGYFDGSDNQLTIGTRPVYEFTGPFTVSAWVNTVASGTILTMQNSGNNGYNLAINYGVIRFCVYANTTEKCVGGGRYPLSSPAWTYFTAVFDGSNISVYANGVFLASSLAANPTASTGPLVFGAAQRGGYSKFTGSLNDIRMYNRALSTNEISSLYNADVGTPNAPTNLQAYPGDSQMGLSWDSPTQGAIVTDYIINYRQSGTNPWAAFAHNPSVVNTRVVTGLVNGTGYDFEVIPVSAIGNGMASSVVTGTPTSDGLSGGNPSGGGSSVVASDDDEFTGPFSSWLNVKTDFGAVGDGVADDTVAFQYAFNALESASSHASVLYIPAGRYKLTSGLDYISTNCATYCTGKSIIGESPTNTILEWHGEASGAAMITLDGIYRMQLDRLTLDGGGAQITLVNETMHQGCCYDGSNEYSDDVFENAAIGLQAGDNTAGCCSAETKVDRDTFANLTKAGISLEDWNALDWYVRYSTFEHDNFGVTNAFGEGGAMHLDHNLFEYNNVDSAWGNGASQSYTYNTSYHSGTFLSGSPYANSSILIGNTILMPQTAAISMPGVGPLTLIDNVIEGGIIAAQTGPVVKLGNGVVSIPNSYVLSMGNTYVSTTPFSVQNVTYNTNEINGDLTSISDAVVSTASIKDALPKMPGALPNYNRPIYDVPQGASGEAIQQTIDLAIEENNGNRPVVHLPWGEYSVNSTIMIPGNSDVQIVGDNMQTIINWTGSKSSPVFALLPSSHATIRNLTINAGSSSAGIVVKGYDQPGDRIYTNFATEGDAGSSHNLLVNGFDNTLVQMDDFGHGGLSNPSSTSVLVVGGPLSQAGNATPGYTGLFMGSSCCNTGPSYRVENGGTIVLTGFWYEQGATGWLDLDGGSGNFIGYEDNIAVGPWGSVTSALPALTANNFTGNLTITNSGIENSYVNLAGSTPSNVLLFADNFNSLVTLPVIANTNTNTNTQAAAIYPTWTGYTIPDEVSGGTSRITLLQNSLTQLASYKDPPIKDLPSTNEDVRLVDIVVNNGVNSFDFESVASGDSPSNQVSRGGSNDGSGIAAHPSTPTSPWCKWINKDGSPAGSIANLSNSEPRRDTLARSCL